MSLAALAATPAAADATGFLGLSFSFGNGTVSSGVSARILSNDAQDEWAAGAGVSYYFTGETDVGALPRSGCERGRRTLTAQGCRTFYSTVAHKAP